MDVGIPREVPATVEAMFTPEDVQSKQKQLRGTVKEGGTRNNN
jgi:hypothetical protein